MDLAGAIGNKVSEFGIDFGDHAFQSSRLQIDLQAGRRNRGAPHLSGELRKADDLIAIRRMSSRVQGTYSMVGHLVRSNSCIDQRCRHGPAKVSLGRNESILLMGDEECRGFPVAFP
jgi:hypothetical protein